MTAVVLFGCGGGTGQGSNGTSLGGSAANTKNGESKNGESGHRRASGGESGEAGGAETTPGEGEEAPPTDYAESHLPFGAAPLSAAQRSRLVKTGQITVPVHVNSGGKLSGFGQAEVEGRIEKVAHAASQTASAAGTVDLRFRLTRTARRALSRGHSFVMYLAIDFSGSRTLQRLTVPLKPQG